jgi:hypothetical protein
MSDDKFSKPWLNFDGVPSRTIVADSLIVIETKECVRATLRRGYEDTDVIKWLESQIDAVYTVDDQLPHFERETVYDEIEITIKHRSLKEADGNDNNA